MAAEAKGLPTGPLDGNHKTCLTQIGLLMEGLGHLVVLPVACVILLDYKGRENFLSEETSVTDTNPNSSRDLFR